MVGERQTLGIPAQPFDAGEDAVIDRPGAAGLQHLEGCVADNDLAAVLGHQLWQCAASDVTGAAGDIEEALAGARIEPGDHLGFPPAMDAAAHQIVHQIVARRDAVEDGAHERRLIALQHAAKAEIGIPTLVAASCLASYLWLAHPAGSIIPAVFARYYGAEPNLVERSADAGIA